MADLHGEKGGERRTGVRRRKTGCDLGEVQWKDEMKTHVVCPNLKFRLPRLDFRTQTTIITVIRSSEDGGVDTFSLFP